MFSVGLIFYLYNAMYRHSYKLYAISVSIGPLYMKSIVQPNKTTASHDTIPRCAGEKEGRTLNQSCLFNYQLTAFYMNGERITLDFSCLIRVFSSAGVILFG